jgi:hypothetical protein
MDISQRSNESTGRDAQSKLYSFTRRMVWLRSRGHLWGMEGLIRNSFRSVRTRMQEGFLIDLDAGLPRHVNSNSRRVRYLLAVLLLLCTIERPGATVGIRLGGGVHTSVDSGRGRQPLQSAQV